MFFQEFGQRPGRRWLDQFLWSPETEDIEESNDDSDKTTKKHKSQEQSLDQSVSSDSGESSTGKFVDTFRYIHPKKKEAYSCWNTASGARKLNYGTRIDYIFADVELTKSACKDCDILADVEGSDHCPVKAAFDVKWIASKKCPSLCTKFMPEFAGRQLKLSSFFNKGSSSQNSCSSQSSQESNSSDNITDHTQMKRSASQSEPVPRNNKKAKLEQQDGSGSQTSSGPDNKKNKLDKQGSGGKQSNLMSFFGKPKSKRSSDNNSKDEPVKTNDDLKYNKISNNDDDSSKKVSPSVQDIPAEKVAQKVESNVQVASAWKSLLKGPRAAPLCRGHKEPCVLRTVKKDGLNKGRQFYTCARGEGPKTNPESRCEHFEWIDKNKSKSKV